nr:hypothetical protein [Tanacetum cinerariifolium]
MRQKNNSNKAYDMCSKKQELAYEKENDQNMLQKNCQNDVIQYRFTKLRIADLMKKFDSISSRLEEDYHSIKDDIPLVGVYTTGNATVRGMRIPDEFIIDDIRATKEYKEYMNVFVEVTTFTTDIASKEKRNQVTKETCLPRKWLKVTTRQKKQSTTLLPPPRDDIERDEMAEATLLSLTLHKIVLATEAKENIAKVQEKLDEEDIEKMPESHKEHPEHVDDDDETEKEKKDDENNDAKENDDEKKDDTDAWIEPQVIDEDEMIPEDTTPELIAVIELSSITFAFLELSSTNSVLKSTKTIPLVLGLVLASVTVVAAVVVVFVPCSVLVSQPCL